MRGQSKISARGSVSVHTDNHMPHRRGNDSLFTPLKLALDQLICCLDTLTKEPTATLELATASWASLCVCSVCTSIISVEDRMQARTLPFKQAPVSHSAFISSSGAAHLDQSSSEFTEHSCWHTHGGQVGESIAGNTEICRSADR